MNFKDKVVVITGGTSGIGKQTAIEFSRKGAHVVAFTVDKEEVCKQAIKEIGNDASYIHCDVSKEEDVKKEVQHMVDTFALRRTFIMEQLDQCKNLFYIKPHGAFYIMVDVSKTFGRAGSPDPAETWPHCMLKNCDEPTNCL